MKIFLGLSDIASILSGLRADYAALQELKSLVMTDAFQFFNHQAAGSPNQQA